MQQQFMMSNPQDVYLKQGVLTANPLELIIMLYDGMKKDLMLAQRAIVKNDMASAHKNLIKAQNIVIELMNCLDLSLSISNDLMDLYEFILHSLEGINIKKDADAITPILEIVGTLRDTWQEVNVSQKSLMRFSEEAE